MKLYKDYTDIAFCEQIVALDTGINMAYYEFGDSDGIPIMLIHGITDGCITWTQMIPEFVKRGYHLYIVEYRGNGLTDKPDAGDEGYTGEMIADDIIDLMDKIGIGEIHIVGHSYGSMVSQYLAVKAPEKVLSCTLMDTGVECKGELIDFAREGDGEFRGMYGYDTYLPEAFCEQWMATTNEDESFRTALATHVKQMPIAGFRNLINGLYHFDSTGFIDKITGKVLVIWGTEDDVFPAEAQKKVRDGLVSCDVTYVNMEGASHNGFWDCEARALEYVEVIDRFLKEIQ